MSARKSSLKDDTSRVAQAQKRAVSEWGESKEFFFQRLLGEKRRAGTSAEKGGKELDGPGGEGVYRGRRE